MLDHVVNDGDGAGASPACCCTVYQQQCSTVARYDVKPPPLFPEKGDQAGLGDSSSNDLKSYTVGRADGWQRREKVRARLRSQP